MLNLIDRQRGMTKQDNALSHTARLIDFQLRKTLMYCHDPQSRLMLTPYYIFATNLIDAPANANPYLNDWTNSDKCCNMNGKGYNRSEYKILFDACQ